MQQKLLDLLSGKKIDSQPAFSGLIHITEEGLKQEGLSLHEIHRDAQKMAKAAGSTFKLTGMPSATLPLDLCSPAEMLGAELNYFEDGELMFPQVKKVLFDSVKGLATEVTEKNEIFERGRLSLICEAIKLVKDDIGKDIVISGMIPGAYTLLLYICNPKNLFIEMKKEPQAVLDALFFLSSFLADVGNEYKKSGADFITIHDMGGSPGFIGPAKYEQFVLPAEKMLIEKLSSAEDGGRSKKPVVLSVCGNVTNGLHLLNQTGADAISVDQTTDLAKARAELKDTLLFGNLDPVGAICQGSEGQIAEAVVRAKEAGVDAVWPGCDLVIQTPLENIKKMI
ncbi:MAG: uroporphyrinogen decarboxylase [Chloroflexi bacterium OLB14]|nr:MAG: uroporphyrinogen decarboxylase [Chloroflexi bacterium OLB14]